MRFFGPNATGVYSSDMIASKSSFQNGQDKMRISQPVFSKITPNFLHDIERLQSRQRKISNKKLEMAKEDEILRSSVN